MLGSKAPKVVKSLWAVPARSVVSGFGALVASARDRGNPDKVAVRVTFPDLNSAKAARKDQHVNDALSWRTWFSDGVEFDVDMPTVDKRLPPIAQAFSVSADRLRDLVCCAERDGFAQARLPEIVCDRTPKNDD